MAHEEYRIPKFTGRGERTTLSAVVDGGMRAMSISIGDVHRVAGFVLPGDRVNIMLTRATRDNVSFTDTLLQNIKVLAIDHFADERADKPSLAKTATVEVNSIDALKLTLAQTVGSLSLALHVAGSVEAAAPRRITMKDLGPALFGGGAVSGEIGDFPNDPLRCDYPYGPCDAFEIGETAVDFLTKNTEEGFQAIETRINQLGKEFNGTQPIDTGAVPFNPNARGDFPNSPLRCDVPYGPCQKWLKPAHKWFNPG
jgi:hypothetical protein